MVQEFPSTIFSAAANAELRKLRAYLESGGDANAVDKSTGDRLLCLAASNGDIEVGQLLIEYGAEPNIASCAWPIHFAAGRGHIDFVELLLRAGSEVHCLDEDGGTPLADAAAGGYPEIVELLLEAGADPLFEDRYGKRAIRYAAEKGHHQVVELLAAYSPERELELANLQLKFAGTDQVDEEFMKYADAANSGDLATIVGYIQNNGDPNAFSLGGDTLLMKASRRGRIEVIEYLLANGANPNQVNENGCCALDSSLSAKTPEAYELLFPLTDTRFHKRAERDKQKKLRSKFSNWGR